MRSRMSGSGDGAAVAPGFLQGRGRACHRRSTASGFTDGTLAAETRFSKVVDLTHTLSPDFPTFFGKPQLEIESMFSYEKDKFNINRWHLVEHTGTHMDAPLHSSADGASVDKVDLASLVVPLAVIDVKAKAAENPDYQLLPEDLAAWESANGMLPENCCVAMNSGWMQHFGTDKYRNEGADGILHFPGFHPDAAKLMMGERRVVGMAVDTLSLDHGASPDFATHYA